MKTVLLSICSLALLTSGCRMMEKMMWRPGSFTIDPETEVVMTRGMKIAATNRNGTIEIEAGRDSRRKYTWDGATREVLLVVRKARWYGSLGLYSPGSGISGTFSPHNGISRAVVEEGQQHFETIKDALKWLNQPYQQRTGDTKYTNSGLVVRWSKSPSRRQLNVDVWQIYINGKKPTHLPGANDAAIQVSYPQPGQS